METTIGADAAKLAGLQIDLLQKFRKGQVTLNHLEWFNKLTKEERDRFCKGLYTINESLVITIDRTVPFDPVGFLSQGWTIEEQDEHSLVLTQVDVSKVLLEHMLKKNENWIKGEEKLKRLKSASYVRLDAKVFQTLWENQQLIPKHWKKERNGKTTYIFFDGTVLRSPLDRRYVLCLYWNVDKWRRYYGWLEDDWDTSNPSAVLTLASI